MTDDRQNTGSPARLIAKMIEALSWSMPRDYSDHPVIGPAIALRSQVYKELRSEDFTIARLAADEAAVQYILDAPLLDDTRTTVEEVLRTVKSVNGGRIRDISDRTYRAALDAAKNKLR